MEHKLDKAQLQQASHILHLANHRNKNQHRAAKWWKWLSMLRRSIDKLIQSQHTGGDLKSFTARIQHLRAFIVPGCFTAFNDLIADPQFAALGLVLLATLARIYGLIRDGNGKKQEDDEEVLRRSLAFEGTAPVASTARERTLGEVEVNEDVVEDERMVDVGEIVPRDLSHVENKLLKEHGDDRADVNSSGYDDGVDSMRVEVRATSPRQRKTEEDRRQEAAEGEEAVRGERQKSLKESSRPRKRKKNAIDELFKGLV